jgi:hypothetical protein
MHPHSIIDSPLCACGCGQSVTIYRGIPRKYIRGHNRQQHVAPKACEKCGRVFAPRRRDTAHHAQRYCSKNCAGSMGAPARKSNPGAPGHGPLAPPEVRFWRHVDKSGECWVWTGHKHRFGYGLFALSGRQRVTAHRFSFYLSNGPIPDELCVCHKCDNPSCVRPNHLELGSQAYNVKDMWSKRRANPGWAGGEKNGMSKLTEEAVRDIRSRYATGKVSQYALAREYGVTRPLIGMIVRGQIWQHLI